jgi:hypothetical protein
VVAEVLPRCLTIAQEQRALDDVLAVGRIAAVGEGFCERGEVFRLGLGHALEPLAARLGPGNGSWQVGVPKRRRPALGRNQPRDPLVIGDRLHRKAVERAKVRGLATRPGARGIGREQAHRARPGRLGPVTQAIQDVL